MKKKITLLSTVLLALILVGAIAFVLHKPAPIPKKVRQQVSFVIFYPNKSSEFQVTRDQVSYNATAKVATIPTKSNAGAVITLNEQATPQQFVDIPQYFSALVEKLNNYSSFESANGHVDLTHPKELKGEQQALLNTKGTLMFAHPSHDLTDDQWRRFFNSLTISE